MDQNETERVYANSPNGLRIDSSTIETNTQTGMEVDGGSVVVTGSLFAYNNGYGVYLNGSRRDGHEL